MIKDTYRFLSFDKLSSDQLDEYRAYVSDAFPELINRSQIVLSCWEKVEKYFPEFQQVLIDEYDHIIGMICTLPYFWDKPLEELPDEGWDWLMQKGIEDYENHITPNLLGGLQIVIPAHHRGKGWSKHFIAKGKEIMRKHHLAHFTLPIRPTFKHLHPALPMSEYMHKKTEGKIYDPWIRTHLNSGAQVIRICPKSMHVEGDMAFWNDLTGRTIQKTGDYEVNGALNLVHIDPELNRGDYWEDNIWIYY